MPIFKKFLSKRNKKLNPKRQEKRQELFLKVRDMAVELLKIQDPEKIRLGTNFTKDLNVDSLDSVELIMELESAFDLEIPDEEAERLLTVEDVINYLENKV